MTKTVEERNKSLEMQVAESMKHSATIEQLEAKLRLNEEKLTNLDEHSKQQIDELTKENETLKTAQNESKAKVEKVRFRI